MRVMDCSRGCHYRATRISSSGIERKYAHCKLTGTPVLKVKKKECIKSE